MENINVNCLMCGKSYSISGEHKDYIKLTTKSKAVYICDKCNHKVRYETEEQNKAIKPM
ncbi:MAG: DUF2197 domain-containing protein [Syntrophomonadaceae bacterium]|nr:DUF2197 domain-containing protein [Syntrophomonadaceae bacterium]